MRDPRADREGKDDGRDLRIRAAVTRIGADVGGTFTDVVVTGDDGCMTFRKVLSTPPAYDRAVVEAVQSLGGADEVVHGTTVATNAVLEQRGALTAVVTSDGCASRWGNACSPTAPCAHRSTTPTRARSPRSCAMRGSSRLRSACCTP